MRIADRPNLVGLIIVLIISINFILAVFLDKKMGISELKVTIIVAFLNAFSLSFFLYLILRYDGFDFVYNSVTFLGLFIFQILLRGMQKGFHNLFFK